LAGCVLERVEDACRDLRSHYEELNACITAFIWFFSLFGETKVGPTIRTHAWDFHDLP
ncbi:hypothetical protein ILYODFUR_000306, partial [Ilyodon furcidens]